MCDAIDLFATVIDEFHNHSKWDEAALGKIKILSNTLVGSVGQLFIERLCAQLAIDCEFPVNKHGKRASQNAWDIKINGVSFELKTATEDVGGSFQFNHIRYHRQYQALLCLGVSPNNLYFRTWTKAEVTTGIAGNLVSMEKNANASYKLTKKPTDLYEISNFEREIHLFIKNFY